MFKVGDRVKCINNRNSYLTKGVRYTVSKVGIADEGGEGIQFMKVEYPDYFYSVRRFEKVKISNEERIALRMKELQDV